MRDIRSDLQDRANLIKAEISTAQHDFKKRIEQLKLEHQSRIKNPVRELEAVKLVIGIEERRLGTGLPSSARQPRLAQDTTTSRQVVKLAS
jgi:hypothetical protein